MDLPGTINGAAAWGGNPSNSVASADGSVFWARNEKVGTTLYYSVYHQATDGELTLAWRSDPQAAGTGQGVLAQQPNGQLVATYFLVAGDGQPARRSPPIPGYVSLPVGGALSYEAFLALMQRLIADASKPTDAALFFAKFVNERGAAGAKWLLKQAVAAVGGALGA